MSRIVLPQIRLGVAAAWVIAFILTFGELGVSIPIAPPGEATLPIRIYTIVANTPSSHVTVLALLQVAVILVPLAVLSAIATGREAWVTAALVVTNVTKRFGSHQAADRVSLEVAVGDAVVVVGPSGCGKTTLLRLIAGLEVPDSGEICLSGKQVASRGRSTVRAHQREIGFVFQDLALWPHLTVRKDAGCVAWNWKVLWITSLPACRKGLTSSMVSGSSATPAHGRSLSRSFVVPIAPF